MLYAPRLAALVRAAAAITSLDDPRARVTFRRALAAARAAGGAQTVHALLQRYRDLPATMPDQDVELAGYRAAARRTSAPVRRTSSSSSSSYRPVSARPAATSTMTAPRTATLTAPRLPTSSFRAPLLAPSATFTIPGLTAITPSVPTYYGPTTPGAPDTGGGGGGGGGGGDEDDGGGGGGGGGGDDDADDSATAPAPTAATAVAPPTAAEQAAAAQLNPVPTPVTAAYSSYPSPAYPGYPPAYPTYPTYPGYPGYPPAPYAPYQGYPDMAHTANSILAASGHEHDLHSGSAHHDAHRDQLHGTSGIGRAPRRHRSHGAVGGGGGHGGGGGGHGGGGHGGGGGGWRGYHPRWGGGGGGWYGYPFYPYPYPPYDDTLPAGYPYIDFAGLADDDDDDEVY